MSLMKWRPAKSKSKEKEKEKEDQSSSTSGSGILSGSGKITLSPSPSPLLTPSSSTQPGVIKFTPTFSMNQFEELVLDSGGAEDNTFDSGKAMGFLSFTNEFHEPVGGPVGFMDFIEPQYIEPQDVVNSPSVNTKSKGSSGVLTLGKKKTPTSIKSHSRPTPIGHTANKLFASTAALPTHELPLLRRDDPLCYSDPLMQSSSSVQSSSGAMGFLAFTNEEDEDSGGSTVNTSKSGEAKGFLAYTEDEEEQLRIDKRKKKHIFGKLMGSSASLLTDSMLIPFSDEESNWDESSIRAKLLSTLRQKNYQFHEQNPVAPPNSTKSKLCTCGIFIEKDLQPVVDNYVNSIMRLVSSGRSPSKKMTAEFLTTMVKSQDGQAIEELSYPVPESVVDIAAGPNSFIAVTCKGDAIMCSSVELRPVMYLGSLNPRNLDPPISKLVWDCTIKRVACGHVHFAAITEKNELITWGQTLSEVKSTNLSEQETQEVSRYDNDGHLGYTVSAFFSEPRAVSGLEGTLIDVACGAAHCAVATTRGVYCWGLNLHGQLGHRLGTTGKAPALVEGLPEIPIKQVACGLSHTLALTEHGVVYAWGSNMSGQLGLESKVKRFAAERILELDGIQIKQIACGESHSAALGVDGLVYTWGSNTYGELGRKVTKSAVGVARLERCFVTHIACGTHNTIACTDEGDVYVWGRLSTKHFTCNSSLPTCLPMPAYRNAFCTAVAAGDMHIVLLQDIALSDLLKQVRKATNSKSSEDVSNSSRKLLVEVKTEASLSDILERINSDPEIEIVDLSKHYLTECPKHLLSLKHLRNLYLCENLISNIAPISSITSLVEINLTKNNITSLPPSLSNLVNLRKANFSRNSLTSLPYEIAALKYLRVLIVSHNKLEEIVESIGQLEALEQLDVSYNVINDIPKQMGTITTLKRVNASNNPLRKVPEYLRDDQAKLMDWIRNISHSETTRNYRIKLMVVGDENVGKTSLINCLRNPKQKKDTIATDGIEISEWIENATIDGQKIPVRFDIWDFAGQDIYLVTHQFFLSSRAIYAIIFNPLDLNINKIHYWLKSIQGRGAAGAPVILVGTHLDDKLCNSSLIQMVQSQFQKIFTEFRNISKSEAGVKELRQLLLSVALEQPFVGELQPPGHTLLEAETIVARKVRNPPILTWAEWQKMAEKCGITPSTLPEVTQVFANMGVISYFGDTIATLKEMVILDPQWLTKAMATVISLKNTMIREGILRELDWPLIWRAPDFPPKVHRPLVDLLASFEILYQLDLKGENNGLTCLIPVLLKGERPKDLHLSWPKYVEGTNLCRVIQFDFCPLGFFSRLTVRLLHMSKPIAYWQNGIVIRSEDGTSKALLEFILVPQPKLKIEVRGQAAPQFLRLLLEIINGMIEGTFSQDAEIERFVVCNHCIAKRSFQPYLFPYKTLIVALTEKRAYVYCSGYRPVIVHQLVPDLAMLDIPHIPFNEIKIEKEIGQGGFGIIHKGTYQGAPVAIKQLIINKNSDNPDEALDKFSELSTEAWFMSFLKHPNIVQLHGVCVDPICLVCEFIPHGDLYHLLKDKTKHYILTNKMAFRIAEDIAKGMKFLHALYPPIIHRDLKSPNILLASLTDTDSLVAKVADFGIAGIVAQSVKGGGDTYSDWQPPEVQNSQEYTTLADVYGFGVIMWELVAKQRPFAEFTFKSMFRKRKAVQEGLRPTIPSGCPTGWRYLMQACWASNPQQRPNFDEVLLRMEQIREEFYSSEPIVVTETEAPFRNIGSNSPRTNVTNENPDTKVFTSTSTESEASEDESSNPSLEKPEERPENDSSYKIIRENTDKDYGTKTILNTNVTNTSSSSPMLSSAEERILQKDELQIVKTRASIMGLRFFKFIAPKAVLTGAINPTLCLLTTQSLIWGGCEDGTIFIWSSLKEHASEMKLHTKGVTDLLLFGDTMWSASRDCTINIWEESTKKHKKTLVLENEVLSLLKVRDTVWSGTKRGVHVWTSDLKQSKEITIGNPVNSMIKMNGVVWLATDGIERWNATTLKKQDHILQGTPIYSLVIADNQVWASCEDGIVILHAESGEFLDRIDRPQQKTPVKLLSYGSYVFSGGADGTIIMWNKRTHACMCMVTEDFDSSLSPLTICTVPGSDTVQLWCGRNNKLISIWCFKDYCAHAIIDRFPVQEMFYASSTPLAFITGPEIGISKAHLPKQIKLTKYAAGQSISTFNVGSPENLITDCYFAEIMPQYSVIGLADGVRAGMKSKKAAVAALSAGSDHLITRLKNLKKERPSIAEMVQILFKSFRVAHSVIVESGQSGTADMCLGTVMRLVQENELSASWAFIGANIGVNKCYCLSNKTKKVTEITRNSTGSLGIGDKGPLEVSYGAGEKSDNVVVPYFFPVDEGDIIFMLSDGLHSNFDPEVLRSSPSCLGFTTSNWSSLAIVSPTEMAKRKQNFLEDLILDLLGDADLPRTMVDKLMDFAIEVTKEKREFVDRVNSMDQKAITKSERIEIRETLKKIRGRLGHATCVSIKVGEYAPANSRLTFSYNNETYAVESENQTVGLPFSTSRFVGFNAKEGFLHKLGSKLQMWHSRYFVLTENTIRYYKKPRDKKPKCEITLTPKTKVLLLSDEFDLEKNGKKKRIKKPDCFLLNSGSKVLYLHAFTKEEACEWVEFINNNRTLTT